MLAGSSRTPTSRSASSARSCGAAPGSGWPLKAVRRLGRTGAAAFSGDMLRLGARLARDGVRLRARARPARALGAAHRARPRRCGLGLHGAGDRRRGAGRRHAGPARRRREAGRCARPADPRPRRLVRDRARRRARARPVEARGRRACSTDGERIDARRAVIANVTPSQLYERLLAETEVPAPLREGARRFRHGRAEMQIHFALSEPARWDGDDRLARTAIVHLTPGPRRRLARGQRGAARPAAGRGDRRRRPAADDRPVPGARRQGHPLDPAAGAALADQGRRRGRDRRGRRRLERRVAGALRRPDPGASRAAPARARVDDPEARRARAARPASG